MDSTSDDEPITLSGHALAALQEFKKDEERRVERFNSLLSESEKNFELRKAITIDEFKEDWQLSQFWYDDATSETLAKAVTEGSDENTVIAIASAPSVYAALLKLPKEDVPTNHIYLLEYDQRFKALGGDKFFAYDYNNPHAIPECLRNKVNRLIVDPPFLESECQQKTAIAAHNLLNKDKSSISESGDLQYKLISSTGERMKDVVKANYPDCHMTDFYPQHKNGLSNEFRCYASFECPYWKFV